jgi:hypothetical protein
MSEAHAVAAGQFGAIPAELPSEADIELVGSASCDSRVAQVRSRSGQRGWIPVDGLPPRLQSLRGCANEPTSKPPGQTSVGKPPFAGLLQLLGA